ncbi:cytochrome P450 [Hypoxylon rubiginosum]|uniref:Cytochrome P450 n=1 Tax=Hypoxylon rubiginosum TaxID=110542 RepID=A0ACB9Z2J0_9PEZI|nr:cytochrome P450 [Hypoxylon rubiginosum]
MADLNIANVYLPTAFFLILVFLYKYVLYPAFISPLSAIPTAHWSCSVSPAWILWARFKQRENRTLYAAHRQHGPIVRIGPNELCVNSVEAVKTIYQGGFDKHQWYSLFDNYGVPCVFSSLHSKPHSLRKRMVSHVYSKSYINSSPALAAQASAIINERLLPLLASSEKDQGGAVDVHSLFCATAMDFISAYCFGLARCAEFIQRKPYREHWLALYTTRKGWGFFAQELPRLSRALRRAGIYLTPSWVDAANRELEAWCKARADATVRSLEAEGPSSSSSLNTADDPVVVRALLAGIEREQESSGAASPLYPTAIRRRELSVASEILDHVLAGQETTGVALTYLAYHLSRRPGLQRELRDELLTLRPNMKLGGEDGAAAAAAHPDSRRLDGLPLLHAVIMETVRRHAPAGGPEPRVAPACRIGPYEVPAGVRVSASAFNLHRNEVAFPEPETWDHTRWLQQADLADDGGGGGGGGEKMTDVNRHFWGFSSGGRMCLGSNFAMHDMKLVIAAIYSNYTSHIIDDGGIEETDAYTSRPKGNSLWLRFERIA